MNWLFVASFNLGNPIGKQYKLTRIPGQVQLRHACTTYDQKMWISYEGIILSWNHENIGVSFFRVPFLDGVKRTPTEIHPFGEFPYLRQTHRACLVQSTQALPKANPAWPTQPLSTLLMLHCAPARDLRHEARPTGRTRTIRVCQNGQSAKWYSIYLKLYTHPKKVVLKNTSPPMPQFNAAQCPMEVGPSVPCDLKASRMAEAFPKHANTQTNPTAKGTYHQQLRLIGHWAQPPRLHLAPRGLQRLGRCGRGWLGATQGVWTKYDTPIPFWASF